MIEENSITVHLLSNARPTSPEQISNTIGNFITRLPRKLNFSEDWEVALTSISYTKSWYNIHKDQKLKLVQDTSNEFQVEELLPAGNYEIEDLLTIINQIFERFLFSQTIIKTPPILTYNQQSNKVIIQLGLTNSNEFIFPKFTDFLANLLGLTDSQNRQYGSIKNYKKFIHKERIIQKDSNDIYINLNEPVRNPSNTTIVTETPSLQEPVINALNTTNVTETPSSQNNSSQVSQSSSQQTVVNRSGNQNTGGSVDSRKQVQQPTNKYIKLEPKFHSRTVKLPQQTGIESLSRAERSVNEFEEKTFVQGFGEVTLFGTIKSLFVYCNIIKPNIVSDTEVPLIRRVEIPSDKKFGQTVEINYSLPEYYPLVTHEFQSIEIDIKDDTNKRIEFAFGRVSIALRFRKKNDGLKSLQKLLF